MSHKMMTSKKISSSGKITSEIIESHFPGEIRLIGTKLTFSGNLCSLIQIAQLFIHPFPVRVRIALPKLVFLERRGVRRVHVKLNSTEVKS